MHLGCENQPTAFTLNHIIVDAKVCIYTSPVLLMSVFVFIEYLLFVWFYFLNYNCRVVQSLGGLQVPSTNPFSLSELQKSSFVRISHFWFFSDSVSTPNFYMGQFWNHDPKWSIFRPEPVILSHTWRIWNGKVWPYNFHKGKPCIHKENSSSMHLLAITSACESHNKCSPFAYF